MKAKTIYVDELVWNRTKKKAKEKLGLSMSAYIELLLRVPVQLGNLDEGHHFHMGIIKDKTNKEEVKQRKKKVV